MSHDDERKRETTLMLLQSALPKTGHSAQEDAHHRHRTLANGARLAGDHSELRITILIKTTHTKKRMQRAKRQFKRSVFVICVLSEVFCALQHRTGMKLPSLSRGSLNMPIT